MYLKEYQKRILDELSNYLSVLRKKRDTYLSYINDINEDIRKAFAGTDFAKESFLQCSTTKSGGYEKKDGLGTPLPDIYIKVPTGGGKTLLAVHAVDAIRREYLVRSTGITLWIVPSEQIYRQTLQQLKDRTHPYRQILEVASGGRVLVRKRNERVTAAECESQHVIILLMLPSANRRDKETLRMFKDSGGFGDFFPPEDQPDKHAELLKQIPNLDCFPSFDGISPPQIMSSLGNVLRLHRPLIVVDEGQKAYSQLARETICGFNPSFILELSATPPPASNVLTQAGGRELDREEMIKLDINLVNRDTPDWKQTLLAAVEKRNTLEKKADAYRQNGGHFIRPIALVQVENTGKEARNANTIHSEDAREYLIQQCGIPAHHIAVKTFDINELGDADLLAEECPIRYVITKQALQEGWDCSFAYVLTVLSHLRAETSMTQLVGRVLRQPYAKKTGVKELDECYVYTNRSNSGQVVSSIKESMEKEGLGGLDGRIRTPADKESKTLRHTSIAGKFNRFAGKIYLPQFVVKKGKSMRVLDYEADILARLDWNALYHPDLAKLSLAEAHKTQQYARIGWADDSGDELRAEKKADSDAGLPADPVLMTQQLLDVVPHPWYAYAKAERILKDLEKKEKRNAATSSESPQARIAANFTFIVEEAKRLLAEARDDMAREYFEKQVSKGAFELVLFTRDGKHSEYYIPKSVRVHSNKRLNRADGDSLEKSLFDYVPDEDFNGLERSVALYLDEQEKLLWWYRNQVHGGYAIQGWKRSRVYPDFIAATKSEKTHLHGRKKLPRMGKVLVMETKGTHLSGSEDTRYKRTLLGWCNKLCASATNSKLCNWEELAKDFADHEFCFQIVEEDGWENTINAMLKQ